MLLGQVSNNGVIRYSGDINDCRQFLTERGLEIDMMDITRGWHGNGYSGLIQYWNGTHHAACWKDIVAKAA